MRQKGETQSRNMKVGNRRKISLNGFDNHFMNIFLFGWIWLFLEGRGTGDRNKYTIRRPPNNKANRGIYGENGPLQARSKIIWGMILQLNLFSIPRQRLDSTSSQTHPIILNISRGNSSTIADLIGKSDRWSQLRFLFDLRGRLFSSTNQSTQTHE